MPAVQSVLALGLLTALIGPVAAAESPSAAPGAVPAVSSEQPEERVPRDIAEARAADPQGSLPEEGKDLRIEEKVGDTVPLDIPFVDAEGKSVTLADYLIGDLPVILTFNYSSCPMLCNTQLNGLIEGMNKILFVAGEQYQIVTIAIDHLETPKSAKATRDKYVSQFPEAQRKSVRRGWTFLTGEEQNIRKMADAVGFPYRYLDDEKEFAHPASIIFLSPTGIVTRYYHGIYYEPNVLSQSIFKAGAGEHGVSVGFLLACLRPNHEGGPAKTGEVAMRYGGIGFVLFLLAAFGTWQMMRTRSARQEHTG